MRLTVLSSKVSGKILAAPIYTKFGNIYMNKGVAFTDKAIYRLIKAGIRLVYIDDGVNEVILEEILDTRTKFKLITELKGIFKTCIETKQIDERKVVFIAEQLLEHVSVSENAFLYNNLSDLDNETKLCLHSIDVAALSIIMGYGLRYDHSRMLKLAIGALLHDIGRLFSSDEDHTRIGYEMMKSNPFFSTTSYFIALSHHEYEDGSGFPEHIMGERCHEFAKVVGICNEYVNGLNKTGLLPHEIIERLGTMVPDKINDEIYKAFLGSIYCYPNGLTLKLNNGVDAVVIRQNRSFPARPLVAYKDGDEVKLLNLINQLTVFVQEIIF